LTIIEKTTVGNIKLRFFQKKVLMMTDAKSLASLKGRRHLPHLLYAAIAGTVKIFCRSFRVEIIDQADIRELAGTKPVILVNWHNRLVFIPGLVSKAVRVNTAVLASASRDGEYAAQYMKRFGLTAVRGSSSKGGRRALVEMRNMLLDGWSVALTPDGPRGPRYHVHPGAVMLAEMTGAPIVPLGFNAPSRWQLGGWDRTQIPKPFSRVQVHYGKPMFIPERLNSAARKEKIEELRRRLLEITID
jgi:hypothetical protein